MSTVLLDFSSSSFIEVAPNYAVQECNDISIDSILVASILNTILLLASKPSVLAINDVVRMVR